MTVAVSLSTRTLTCLPDKRGRVSRAVLFRLSMTTKASSNLAYRAHVSQGQEPKAVAQSTWTRRLTLFSTDETLPVNYNHVGRFRESGVYNW